MYDVPDNGLAPAIDGVARAKSRYHVIDGFGASGGCRRAHRHAGADDAFSGAHLAAASVPSRRTSGPLIAAAVE